MQTSTHLRLCEWKVMSHAFPFRIRLSTSVRISWFQRTLLRLHVWSRKDLSWYFSKFIIAAIFCHRLFKRSWGGDETHPGNWWKSANMFNILFLHLFLHFSVGGRGFVCTNRGATTENKNCFLKVYWSVYTWKVNLLDGMFFFYLYIDTFDKNCSKTNICELLQVMHLSIF